MQKPSASVEDLSAYRGSGSRRDADLGSAFVSIVRHGPYLIASIHAALDDSQLVLFQQELTVRIGEHRSRAVIIDVAGLDVLDSFSYSTLRQAADSARVRGASTVLVGIQPDVALAMAGLGLPTGATSTAADLEDVESLTNVTAQPPQGPPRSDRQRASTFTASLRRVQLAVVM